MSFLKNLDLFGSEIRLNLNSQNKIKTHCGGLLTLLVIFIISISFYLLEVDVFNKNNPSSFKNQIILEDFTKINLNSSNFPLIFSISDVNGKNLNFQNYLNIDLMNFEYRIKESGESELLNENKILMVKCEKRHFQLFQNYYKSLVVDDFYCFNNFEVFGNFKEGLLKFIKIQLKHCNNSKSCKNKSEIENFIIKNKLKFNFLTLDPLISIKDYESPILYNSQKFSKILKVNFKSEYSYQINQNKIETDSGFIYEDFESKSFFDIKETCNDFQDFDEEEKILIELKIQPSNIINVTYRRYTKLPEVIGIVGGLLYLFSLLFKLLNFYISDLSKILYILNSLFEIKNEDKNLNISKFIFNKQNFKINKKVLNDENNNPEINLDKSVEIVLNENRNYNISNNKESFSIINIDNSKILSNVNHNNLNENLNLNLNINQKFENFVLEQNQNFGIKKEINISHYKIKFSILEKCKIIIFNLICSSKKLRSQGTKVNLIIKGKLKIDNYLNIITIIKTLDEFNLVQNLLLTNVQKEFIKNTKPTLL